MKLFLRLLSVCLLVVLFACSQEPSSPEPAGNDTAPAAATPDATTTEASAEPAAAATPSAPPAVSPEDTARQFIEAANAADQEKFLSFMTDKARATMTADPSTLDLGSAAFDSYEIAPATITGDQAAVPVNAVIEGESQTVTLNMRNDNSTWKIFGVKVSAAEGMEITLNFEDLGEIFNTMADQMGEAMEQMGDAMAEGLGDAFGGDSPEELAAKRARFEALKGMTPAAFDATWMNTTDYKGKPALDALTELARSLGLVVVAGDNEAALAKAVEADVTEVSKLEAIERICERAGVYPAYPELEYGGGALAEALAGAMTTMLQGVVESVPGVEVDTDIDPEDAAEPPANAIKIVAGARPFPVAFAGPFLMQITNVVENAPHTTGSLQIAVRGFGLDPAVAALLENQMELVRYDRVVDAQDRSLIEEGISYLGAGTLAGSAYASMYSLDLYQLIREVETIHEISGAVMLAIPETIFEVTVTAKQLEEPVTAADLSIVAENFSDSVELKVTGPEIATENLHAYYAAEDEAGQPVGGYSVNTYSWEAGVANVSISLNAAPAKVLVKLAPSGNNVEYAFAFPAVALKRFAEMPERVEELQFENAPSPVTAKFVGVAERDGSFVTINVELQNHSNKDAMVVYANMAYLNAAGETLGESSTTFTGEFTSDGQTSAVNKASTIASEATAFSMPEEATEVSISVSSIEFIDGTGWVAEE